MNPRHADYDSNGSRLVDASTLTHGGGLIECPLSLVDALSKPDDGWEGASEGRFAVDQFVDSHRIPLLAMCGVCSIIGGQRRCAASPPVGGLPDRKVNVMPQPLTQYQANNTRGSLEALRERPE